jgi:tRNA threonylcarbamoyladenosine biosynthesis protein TsaE
LDLYRLNNAEEAFDIGIEELLYDHQWVFIEWPDVIDDLLPDNCFGITIDVDENETRKIVLSKG